MHFEIKKVDKMKKVVIIFVVTISLFAGCQKEKQTLRESLWIVESMKVHKDSALQDAPSAWLGGFTLEFVGKQFVFSLKYNTIRGKVRIGNNKIDFETESIYGEFRDMFSESCLHILTNNINRYNIYDEHGVLNCKVIYDARLVLTGDNGEKINFVRLKEFL